MKLKPCKKKERNYTGSVIMKQILFAARRLLFADNNFITIVRILHHTYSILVIKQASQVHIFAVFFS